MIMLMILPIRTGIPTLGLERGCPYELSKMPHNSLNGTWDDGPIQYCVALPIRSIHTTTTLSLIVLLVLVLVLVVLLRSSKPPAGYWNKPPNEKAPSVWPPNNVVSMPGWST
jgi:hypothetical protein